MSTLEDRTRAGELTIAEAARRTGLTTHTLRYYEAAGLMISTPGRTPAGRRRYGPADLGWIELVQRLRATGTGIAEVREYAELVRAGAGTEAARLALLRAHRERVLAQLAETAAHLAAISTKIELYEARTPRD